MSRDKLQNLGIAVIGLGHWGPNILTILRDDVRVKKLVACELSEARTGFMRNKFPDLNITSKLEDALQDPSIHAVVIATPTATHYSIAKECIAAGKHLLVEKPIADSYDKAIELTHLAEKAELTLMVGHTFLFNNAIREMNSLISGGRIGNILYLSSLRANLGPVRKDVSALWDLASHDLSIFSFLFSSHAISCSCTGLSLLSKDLEDVAQGTLEYANGKRAIFAVSWLDSYKIRDMRAVGTHGSLLFDDLVPDKPLRIIERGINHPVSDAYADSFHSFQAALPSNYFMKVESSTGQPLRNEIQHFLECLVENKTPLSDGKFACKIVKTLEALERSIKTGGIPQKVFEVHESTIF